jgi:photosystem II stability/assembly factor-like uncharacterized protein
MSQVRVLVGTRKGAFVLTSDGKREQWDVSGPHFAGWEIYHVKGSAADPNRLYASQSSGWFGQLIQRSNDGGKTWEAVGNKFAYDGIPGTHQWYDGTPHPWEFKRVWHLEPSLGDADTVYAGIEDAALFRSTDGGQTWQELSGLRGHGSGPQWQPGAGGMCLHTIILDPSDPGRMFIAISAAGAFRTDDGGNTWRPINRGLHSQHIPDPRAEVGHCVHHVAMHPSRPGVLFMQKHWDVMRSDDAGDSWKEVSGNLPTDFGFVIDVHAHEPETVYVVPIKSDSEHYVPDGKLRVFRSRTGGNEWEALTKGLPQANCYVNVLRDAMAVDSLDQCGVYFGTSGGQVYVSADAGDNWAPIVRDLPPVLSVEVQTLACCDMIRVLLPHHLRTLAHIGGEVELEVAGEATLRSVLDALEARYPMLRGTIRDQVTQQRRPFLRFFACEEDLSHEAPDVLLPDAVRSGAEPLIVIGAIAGG